MSKAPTDVIMGAIQGQIELPCGVKAEALRLGGDLYRTALAEEFSGESVTWLSDKALLGLCLPFFPLDAVRALGYEPVSLVDAKVYGTCSVESHTDGEGIIFVMALSNQGLKFKQKSQIHETESGEWFLFNDRVAHEVRSNKSSMAYVFLHVPLRAI